MSEIKNSSDGFYNKIFETYKPEDYFEELEIVINYYKNITSENDRAYKILSLSLEKKRLSARLRKD